MRWPADYNTQGPRKQPRQDLVGGLRFLRTLGWGDRLEFLGGQGYVPSSNFGVFQFSLQGPAELAAR